MSPERHTTHNPRQGLGSRLVWHEIRAESGARADWQACTIQAYQLDYRTHCTVFRGTVVFAMTTMAHLFTAHLITFFVVHQVRLRPDS